MNSLHSLGKTQIPSTWNLLPVGNVLADSQYGTNEVSTENGNTKVAGMKDIQDGKILTTRLAKANLSEKERSNYLLENGDILINRTNSYDLVGKTGIFESNDEVTFASYLVRLKVNKERVYPKYLNYWLNGYIAQKTIKRIATRAISQANVNPTEFKKHCVIPLPPLHEQTTIASLLSTWDFAIEKAERLIEAKEKQLCALYQLYFQPGLKINTAWKRIKIAKLVKPRKEMLVPTKDIPLFSLRKRKYIKVANAGVDLYNPLHENSR